MTTCPTCGTETAVDATCVVCGTQPTTADGAGSAPPPVSSDDAVADAVRGPVAVEDGPSAVDGRDDQFDASAAASADAWPANPGPGPGSIPPPSGDSPGALPPPPTGGPAGPADPAWPASPPPTADALAVSESSRNWGMIAHLSSLVAAGLGGMIFLGPLVVWLVRKDQDRFVAHHAVEALNFNLSVTLYALLAIIVGFTIVGLIVAIPAAIVGFFVWFITSIMAAIKAQRGEGYRYPLTIRLVRE